MSKRYTIRVRRLPDGVPMTIVGREAWALECLKAAGAKGCTPIDQPGPRWSHYVFKLRQAGFSIETIHEPHEGTFSGTHARYVLHNAVEILGDEMREAA